MNPLVTFRVATRALVRHKLRAFLTTLGIVIGVGAVIAMVAIGEGAKAKVQQTFAAMGTNMLIVLPGSFTGGGMRGGFGSASTLTWDDLRAIRELSAVRVAAPALRVNASLVSEEQNWTTQVNGTTPEYFEVRNWKATRGSLFVQADVDNGAKALVIGETVAEKLFGRGSDPIGQIVRIRQAPFSVVGVLASKGQSPMGQDYDDTSFVPVTAYQAKIQGGLQKYIAGQIVVGARSEEDTKRAESQITSLLRDRHRLESGEDDFSVRNLTEFASAQEESTRTLTLLLAAIAAVSLLVGGIGIMNIMLVSVTERTREIGVRMAVGAKPRHILAQFLVESLTLSVAGGLIGVALGVLAARKIAGAFGWPALMPPDIIVIAVAFSALVGVVFGLYPAYQASRLDPIQALRYE
ncbi:MAG: ABC transporter permease [Pseudomonadota bacterium]